jgi:uncharacterized membrane protein
MKPKILTIILTISLLVSIIIIIYVTLATKQEEKFTEFFILSAKGAAFDYPTSVATGDNCSIIVGIINHECTTVNYTLRLALNNASLSENVIELDQNQAWQSSVSYMPRRQGKDQKLDFLLFKEHNFTHSYRELHLFLDVSSNLSSLIK